MDMYGDNARRLRAMGETLSELARAYDEAGQLDERDQVNDAEESVRGLLGLPDPEEEDLS